MRLTRRTLVAGAAFNAPRAAWAGGFSNGAFTHGVASGDPTHDSVILWTRFANAGDGRIGWEISRDETFSDIAASGQANASAANDYCAKIDARGLAPGRPYFYRFLSASGPSVTGQTRTAPAGAAATLRAALFSCSNFAFGYFHAYAHAAAQETSTSPCIAATTSTKWPSAATQAKRKLFRDVSSNPSGKPPR